jgi:hypothetical protein
LIQKNQPLQLNLHMDLIAEVAAFFQNWFLKIEGVDLRLG